MRGKSTKKLSERRVRLIVLPLCLASLLNLPVVLWLSRGIGLTWQQSLYARFTLALLLCSAAFIFAWQAFCIMLPKIASRVGMIHLRMRDDLRDPSVIRWFFGLIHLCIALAVFSAGLWFLIVGL